jgi:acetate kinase
VVAVNALVVNAGSSTLKACLYRVGPGAPLAVPAPSVWRGQITRGSSTRDRADGGADRDSSVLRLLGPLWNGPAAPLAGPDEIDVIGHRVVHGGTRLRAPTIVTGEVKQQIAALAAVAPLHNRAALEGIEATERILGSRPPHVAVFDTAFHADLPAAAYTYAGPRAWLDAGLRRFGFHGINHQYVAARAAHLLGREPRELRLVSCHLGSGGSLAAVCGGRSVDTTMGFTPLDGLAMATRSGSVDPGLLLHLLRSGASSPEQLDEQLNRGSGLAGLSGTDGDMREVISRAERGDERAQLAFDVYVHRLRRCIGAMLVGLGGLDAIVFTGGVGENSPIVRREAVAPLGFLGVELDGDRNDCAAGDADVSAAAARVRTLVIAAREEWAIARSAVEVVAGALV